MKKILILLLFCFIPFNFVLAQDDVVEEGEIIQAGIKYNEATARIAAFTDINRKFKKDFYRDKLKDPNWRENLDLIEKNIFEVKDKRILCPFYLKKTIMCYAVTYYDEPGKVYYYSLLGRLMKFDIVEKGTYPRRIAGYSRYGNLINVAFEVAEDEQFVYNENGKLIAHWVGNETTKSKTQFLKIRRGYLNN